MNDWFQETFGEGSAFRTGLTLLRYPLGISFFLLPWAMKFGGIVAGPFVIALFVVINFCRSHVIAKIISDLTTNGISSPTGYGDWWVLQNSLGKVGNGTSSKRYLFIFLMLQWLSFLGHASAFLAFAGLSFNQVFPTEGLLGLKGARIWIAICTGVVVLGHAITQLLRTIMKDQPCLCVHFCSTFLLILLPAFFAIFFGMPTIVAFASQLAVSQAPIHPSVAVDWRNLGLLLAGIIFIIGATPDDVTATYGMMKDRLSFHTVLLVVAAITMVIGIGFASAVFLGLDERTCGSVTFNLSMFERSHLAIRIISSTCALIFLCFRHQMGPQLFSHLSSSEIARDILLKALFLAVAGGLALLLPTFSGLACIFGSLTSFPLTITFPFLCDLLLHVTGGKALENDHEEKDLLESERSSLTMSDTTQTLDSETPISAVRIVRDVSLMALGLAGTFFGLYTTIAYLQENGITDAAANCA